MTEGVACERTQLGKEHRNAGRVDEVWMVQDRRNGREEDWSRGSGRLNDMLLTRWMVGMWGSRRRRGREGVRREVWDRVAAKRCVCVYAQN